MLIKGITMTVLWWYAWRHLQWGSEPSFAV